LFQQCLKLKGDTHNMVTEVDVSILEKLDPIFKANIDHKLLYRFLDFASIAFQSNINSVLKMRLSKDGIHAQAVDSKHTYLVRLHIGVDDLNNWSLADGVNSFSKSGESNDQTIAIDMDRFHSFVRSYTQRFSKEGVDLRTYVNNSDGQINRMINNLQLEDEYVLLTSDLCDPTKVLDPKGEPSFSHHSAFNLTGDNLETFLRFFKAADGSFDPLAITAQNVDGVDQVVFARGELKPNEMSGRLTARLRLETPIDNTNLMGDCARFDYDTLSLFMGAFQKARLENLTMKVSTDKPIYMCAKLGKNSTVEYMLAPRVDEV